ncbi:MAG: hypothetical protein K0S65_6413 [Labilithrix sp.]|nr:hypothetical protein [Labilithrix sp.]
MAEEELLAVELHAVRDADEADRAARTCRADGLLHRLLRADAFEHGIAFGQRLGALTCTSPRRGREPIEGGAVAIRWQARGG